MVMDTFGMVDKAEIGCRSSVIVLGNAHDCTTCTDESDVMMWV